MKPIRSIARKTQSGKCKFGKNGRRREGDVKPTAYPKRTNIYQDCRFFYVSVRKSSDLSMVSYLGLTREVFTKATQHPEEAESMSYVDFEVEDVGFVGVLGTKLDEGAENSNTGAMARLS
jgi:hypothetical protein